MPGARVQDAHDWAGQGAREAWARSIAFGGRRRRSPQRAPRAPSTAGSRGRWRGCSSRLSTWPLPTTCLLSFLAPVASNVLRLSTVMPHSDGADWPFSQPPYVYLKPGVVAQIVPCGIEAAHPVQCAGSRRAPLSAEFVQNAPHSPTPKVHSPLPSPTQTVSMAASCLRRTPRPPLGYSWARRSLAC